MNNSFELLEVIDARQSRAQGAIDLTVRVSIDTRPSELIPFTYVPSDLYGLSPAIGAWLADNPTFPIAPAAELVAPTPADTPLTMRQLRLGLLLIGGFSATFIQDTIAAIPDPTERGIAQIWYEETSTVEWSHPMTQQLIAAAGISAEQAAAMWMQAKDLAA